MKETTEVSLREIRKNARARAALRATRPREFGPIDWQRTQASTPAERQVLGVGRVTSGQRLTARPPRYRPPSPGTQQEPPGQPRVSALVRFTPCSVLFCPYVLWDQMSDRT
jgi:hypothetical protein